MVCQYRGMSSTAPPPPPPPDGSSSSESQQYGHMPTGQSKPGKPGIPGWFWLTAVVAVVVGLGGGVALGFPIFGGSDEVGEVEANKRVLCDRARDVQDFDLEQLALNEPALWDIQGIGSLGKAIGSAGGGSQWNELGDDLVRGISRLDYDQIDSVLHSILDRCEAEVE